MVNFYDMKAAVITKYGDAEVLEVQDVPQPQINDDEVLVQIAASSVNPIDWKIRKGMLRFLTGNTFPRKLGADFSGRLVKVGKNVSTFKAGDLVYGMESAVKGGAYAEFIKVKPWKLAAKPLTLSHQQAASLPLAGLTAFQSLENVAGLKAGQKVLINGASGGVGSLAVQFAKAMGAEVTASCSAQSRELVASLQPDRIINYKEEPVLPAQPTYHVIFDVHGGLPYSNIRQALLAGGIYLTTQPYPKNFILSFLSRFLGTIAYRVVYVKPKGSDLEQFNALIEAGKLKAVIDSVYPLHEIAEAQRQSEKGHAHGKIVIRISDL